MFEGDAALDAAGIRGIRMLLDDVIGRTSELMTFSRRLTLKRAMLAAI
jgi:hypothetical protein